MQRRKFIKNTILVSSSLLIANSLISCSNNNTILLEEIIGKPEKILDTFKKEGNEYFAYYVLSKFKHSKLTGEQVYIYCQKGIIVGYTIKIKGTDKIQEYTHTFSQQFGDKKIVFENDFGKEYEWRTNNKKITLCYSKDYKGLSQNTYFSESTINNELIVF